MSYFLNKPYTDKQRADFIVLHQGLVSVENEVGLYFLEANEIWDEATQQPILNPAYESEQATAREAEFKDKFFEIAAIESLFTGGWYRRVPKGYTSAIESLNTAFNAVSVLGKLPANTLTFYTAPDFANAEQCTEVWLVANAFKNTEMTATEFGTFYATFLQAWNASEH